MMSGFHRCLCTPNARVFWEHGQVYCVRCLAPRSLLPQQKQTPGLGALGLFYRPIEPLSWNASLPYPTQECNPGGGCWLTAIFPLARMTSGNNNFQQRLNKVASTLYAAGKLSRDMLEDLEIYDRGCRWYPYVGACPGVALYANQCHVSDAPFPGATHVLSNIPLPQMPCKKGFCPFQEAYAGVYRMGDKAIFLTPTKVMWSTTATPHMPEIEEKDKALAIALIRDTPEHHLIDRSVLIDPEEKDEFSLSLGHGRGIWKTQVGTCWAKIFIGSGQHLVDRELEIADTFGYQLTHGVPGPYINRRLHRHGLRAVIKSGGNAFRVWSFCDRSSYIQHITYADCKECPGFVPMFDFTVEPNTEPTADKVVKFARHKFYGYSPPGDGACGLHCLSAVLNQLTVEGGRFKSTLRDVGRDQCDWCTDQHLVDLVYTMGLPICVAPVKVCPRARYVIKLNAAHWEVHSVSGAPLAAIGLDCIRGLCDGNCQQLARYPNLDVKEEFQKACQLPTDLVVHKLKIEPMLASWDYDTAMLADDEISQMCGELFCKAKGTLEETGVPPETAVTLLRCMCDNLESRAAVADSLDKFMRQYESENGNSKSNDLSSPPRQVPTKREKSKRRNRRSSRRQNRRGSPSPSSPSTADSWTDIGTGSDSDPSPEETPAAAVAVPSGEEVSKSDELDVRSNIAESHSQPEASVNDLAAASTNKVRLLDADNVAWLGNELSTKMVIIMDKFKRSLKDLARAKFPEAESVLFATAVWRQIVKDSKAEDAAEVLDMVEYLTKNVHIVLSDMDLPSLVEGLTLDYLWVRLKGALKVRHSYFYKNAALSAFLADKVKVKGGTTEECVPELPVIQPRPAPAKLTLKSEIVQARKLLEKSRAECNQDCQQMNPEPVDSPVESPAPPPPEEKIDLGDSDENQLPNPPGWQDKFKLKMQQAQQWVFDVFSHLPASVDHCIRYRQNLTSGDILYALFCLLCLVLSSTFHAVGALPLVGCIYGNPWRVRISIFSVWCSFAMVLFQDATQDPGVACDSASAECQQRLRVILANNPLKPISTVSVGLLGSVGAVLAKLVGGPRWYWAFCLRLLVFSDVACCFFFSLFRHRCSTCWKLCVRTAPNEVVLKTFPLTKVSKSLLLDLCNKFAPPCCDPIFIATGYPGCYSGRQVSCLSAAKSIPYSALDEKKINSGTVVPPPRDPQQAIKCMKVLQLGGCMQKEVTPQVEKVTQVPFKAPFFPDVTVNPDCFVVVDHPTYIAAFKSGYSTTNLCIGEGDFAKVNNMKAPLRGGAWAMDFVFLASYVLVNYFFTVWLTSPTTCGAGTHDPWCRDPFATPIVGSGVFCQDGLCISTAGLTASLSVSVLSFKHWALTIALIVSALLLVAKFVMVTDVVAIAVGVLLYTVPQASFLAVLAPFALVCVNLSPYTVCWFVGLVGSVSPWSGIACCLVIVLTWLVGRVSNVCGLITPFDVHAVTSKPRGAVQIATAPEGTYLAAVRRAALTGRCCMFVPSNMGSLLEGALRTSTTANNVVTVFGKSSGTGAVFRINGKPVVLTATHLLNGNSARVSSMSFSKVLKFEIKGDFACADVPEWNGDCPKGQFTTSRGKAYWLTSSGVEPGMVTEKFALCFTKCGDSGSVVLHENGDIIGVHTGSNKRGSGLVTTFDGVTIGMQNAKLSEMCKYFSGPCIPVDVPLPPFIEADVSTIPSDLVVALSARSSAEGSLSSIQLICVFVLLWRLMNVPWIPYVAMAFFVANELLPSCVVRLSFSYTLSLMSLFSPWSFQAFMVRLLTAALNRNALSFWFFLLGGVISAISEMSLLIHHNQFTWLFLPRYVYKTAEAEMYVLVCVTLLHACAMFLALFKRNWLMDLLVGNGSFDRLFFLKYFTEGNLRDGVSASINNNVEGLTAALACNLTTEDLEFLQRKSEFKCFVSASNMLNGANEYIEASYAKALRREVARLDQTTAVTGLLAKLDAFVSAATPKVETGDVVIILGRHVVGDCFVLKIGDTSRIVKVIETRNMAGTTYTVAEIVEATVEETREERPQWDEDSCLMKGKARMRKEKYAYRDDHGQRYKEQGVVTIKGESFVKIYDTTTGDLLYQPKNLYDAGFLEGVFLSEVERHRTIGTSPTGRFQNYIRSHGTKVAGPRTVEVPRGKRKPEQVQVETWRLDGEDYDIPIGQPLEWTVTLPLLESEKLTVEQALANMGHNTKLTPKEQEKLQRIVDKLQGMLSDQALNC